MPLFSPDIDVSLSEEHTLYCHYLNHSSRVCSKCSTADPNCNVLSHSIVSQAYELLCNGLAVDNMAILIGSPLVASNCNVQFWFYCLASHEFLFNGLAVDSNTYILVESSFPLRVLYDLWHTLFSIFSLHLNQVIVKENRRHLTLIVRLAFLY